MRRAGMIATVGLLALAGAGLAAAADAAGAPTVAATSAAPAADLVAPNENLVADGVPGVPRTLAERVAQYMEVRAASLVDWHPKRRELLIATRFGEVGQLHRVAFPLGARTQITFYPEPVRTAAYRPGRGDGLVFSKDVGGSEFYQLFWRDFSTGRDAMLTDGKSRNSLGPFSPSGRWLAYHSTRRNRKDNDLYVMDPSDAATDRKVLEVDGGGWYAMDWSPDEKRVLVMEYVSVTDSRVHEVTVGTGEKRRLFADETEAVSYGTAQYAKDGKGIYFTSDRGSDFKRLHHLERASGRLTALTPDLAHDVGELELSDDGKRLAYTVNQDGAETLHVLDVKTRKPLPLPALPLGVIGGLNFHPDGQELGFTFNNAQSASDVYSIHLAGKKLHRWTESETGGLDASKFPAAEAVSWRSFDGRTITGFLYKPPARFAGPRPVIVFLHGGPEGQWQPQFLGRHNYFLNEAGCALLLPNVRGSTGFGKTFVKLDNAEKREDSVRDVGALLDWIPTRPDLDASRVMVRGGSYGGYMTLASLTHYSERLRGGIDEVGIANFVSFLENTEPYRRDLRRVEYGDERDPKMRALLLSISPVTNVSKITRPLFVVQGKNDPRVPWGEAEQMVAAMKKAGTPVWYLLARDEGHGFAKKKNADYLFLASIRFVEEHLLR